MYEGGKRVPMVLRWLGGGLDTWFEEVEAERRAIPDVW